jgi:hypothetical protein
MRLSFFALATGLAMLVGVASAEARPYYGYDNGYQARSYGKRHYAKRSYERQYAYRGERSYSRSRHAYRGERSYSRSRYAYRQTYHRNYAERRTYGRRTYASYGGGGVGGRPAAWCGWWMRTQLGGGPEYNLAANWRNYGHSSGPQVGAVVVWPHHVGIITGRSASGQWIVKSGNDGGAVRERAQSVAGATFRMG